MAVALLLFFPPPAPAATSPVDELISHCPTRGEVESLNADVPLTFEADPTAGEPLACRAANGSADLTRLQERAYQALRVMKALDFSKPLPWTSASLYGWFVHAVKGVSFRNVPRDICCKPPGVINIRASSTAALTTNRWIAGRSPLNAGLASLVSVMVHEARHAEGGHPHSCSFAQDLTVSELGSYGVEYYLHVWEALYSGGFLTAPGEDPTLYREDHLLKSEGVLLDPTGIPNRFCDGSHADLALSGAATPEQVPEGGLLTHTLTARNLGRDAAADAIVYSPVPVGTTVVQATSSKGSCSIPRGGRDGPVSCALGTLMAHGTATIALTLRVDPAGAPTAITNKQAPAAIGAHVTSRLVDFNPRNNSAAAETDVEKLPPSGLTTRLTEVKAERVVAVRPNPLGSSAADPFVACSAGKQVLSGGFHLEDANDVKLGSSNPIANGWRVHASNLGWLRREIIASAICAKTNPSGIAGYEQKSQQVVVGPGATASVSASCSAGKKVLGGGLFVESAGQFQVASSQPSGGQGNLIEDGWTVSARNAGRMTHMVGVTAICASTDPSGIAGYEQKTERAAVGAGASGSLSPQCSPGKKVLGGGFSLEDPKDLRIASSEPSDGHGKLIDNGWSGSARNTGSAKREMTVTAVCGAFRASSWRLGEQTGMTAADQLGRNPGTYAGGITRGVPGAAAGDTAVAFDGSSGRVTVPDSASLDTGDGFTLEAWVKPAQLGRTNEILSKDGAYILLLNGQNQLVLYHPNFGVIAVSGTGIHDTAGFHHVVATKSGATLKLYIDGRDETHPPNVRNQTIKDSTAPLLIGGGSGLFNPFRGALDEVAIYSGALTAREVRDHFEAIAPVPLAQTGPAREVKSTSAVVAGDVNPQGKQTTYYFEYGTDASYGQRTAPQSAGSGTALTEVRATLSGLTPATTYHYQLVATNAAGDKHGGDRTFTTPPKCAGVSADKTGNGTIVGSSGNDVIVGGDGDDTILGGGGKDVICGGGGNDSLEGGASNDLLLGGEGEDYLDGGIKGCCGGVEPNSGDDDLDGGPGHDTLWAADYGRADMIGGPGPDELHGLGGNDTLTGGLGNDSMDGGASNDSLSGGSEKDFMEGAAGEDRLDGGTGEDRVSGGPGDDPNLHGGEGKDTLFGGDGVDSLLGDGDDDYLDGGANNDYLDGGAGNDRTLFGGPGNDRLFGRTGNDALSGGAGDDVLGGDAGADTLDGGLNADKCDGGPHPVSRPHDTASNCETIFGVP